MKIIEIFIKLPKEYLRYKCHIQSLLFLVHGKILYSLLILTKNDDLFNNLI